VQYSIVVQQVNLRIYYFPRGNLQNLGVRLGKK